MRTTIFVAALIFSVPASAAEIAIAGPGCTDEEFAERMFRVRDTERDLDGFSAILVDGMERGICRTFLIGEPVAVEAGAFSH